ncbi:NAD(P)-binding oxidoreductase [Corynebacterium bovis]|uniref:NAD(P)-binding oxidoreductase n=1 Tax=Corynebacterium bovis TaxID=36808 RepID=UPI000F638C4B|nr:NAD(P)-binding oxidoreductase [Corynebacterium bovis]RRO88143.1 NAD-dependent dehydratase [Corynebacterium bovis]
MVQTQQQSRTVTVIGGHGAVALRATPMLAEAGHTVRSVIRSDSQADDVRSAGAEPVVTDVTTLDVAELTDLFAGQDVVVWSAGAGGSASPERTTEVDRDAAVRTMEAAAAAGVGRYIMVSWIGSSREHGVPASADLHAYAEAKVAADAALMDSDLDWTILGPGRLTSDPGEGQIRGVSFDDRLAPGTDTSRENVVAAVAAAVDGHGSRRFVRFADGGAPVAEVFDDAPDDPRL